MDRWDDDKDYISKKEINIYFKKMDCKFKEFVDEIDFWNVCLIEYKIMFLEFYWWNIFFVFFF